MTWAQGKMSKVMKIDEQRDSQFPAWRRNDTHLWSKPKLYLGAMLWMPTRFFLFILFSIMHTIK